MIDLTDRAPSGGADASADRGSTLVIDEDAVDDAEQAPVPPADHARRGLVEWTVVLIGVLLVGLLIRAFLIQVHAVPSESMRSTLSEGDQVAVSSMSYRLGDVNRGDVVVFDGPVALEEDGGRLVQRVVGLPGESIEIEDSTVIINGIPREESYVGAGVEYPDMDAVLVPEDHVFVLGDNRADARDSRTFGPIAIDDIDGRAIAVIWPPSHLAVL